MNLTVVSKNIGLALLFDAAFMLLGALVSLIYGADSALSPLFLSGIITMVTGLFPVIFVRGGSKTVKIKEGFAIIVFAWLLSCLFGMLPYVLWGGEFSLINAWYESVSGFTTTGATILTDIEALPHGLLFWRSSTHFIGGIGVVVFMLLIMPNLSTFRLRLSKIEINTLSRENYSYKARETVMIIAGVYVILAIVAMFALMLAGMDWFDAINHAFSTVATGGFSTRNESILSFHSDAINIVLMVFMLLGSVHFGLLYATVAHWTPKLFKSPVTKFYLKTVLVASLLIIIGIKLSGDASSWWDAIMKGLFQCVSIITTTGFATADTSVWPPFVILILLYLGIQCACSGSTSGGIKSDRVFIFFKSVRTQLVKTAHPNAIVHVRNGGHIIDPELVSSINLFIVLYMSIIFVMAVIFTAMGIDFMDAFSASVSNMGNIGPGFGNVGSMANYSQFPVLAKFLSTVQMLMGRLEIYSFIMIFTIHRWK